MATGNEVRFGVKVDTGDSKKKLDELGQELEQLDKEAQDLGKTGKTTSTAIDGMGRSADTAADKVDQLGKELDQAADGVDGLGESAEGAGESFEEMRRGIDRTTASIKAQLQEQQSEIELQRQHLALESEQQQTILRTARARGDETAATKAENRLREIAAQQLGLLAQAKRAEATAIQQSTAARRQELAAAGPLSEAQQRELQAAENYARSLRVQAAASDAAAQKTRQHAAAAREGAIATQDLGQQTQVATRLLGQMAATLGGAFTFRELVTAASQMEQLERGLAAVSGSAAQASRDLDFIKRVANQIGVDVNVAGKAFLSLAASTKGTAVEGQVTRDVFEAVASSMAKAGRSTEETERALTALSQMASKGAVSMEELRGQLGEALPGALQAAARGLGVTTTDLIKLVEEGQVAAEDLFPALTKGLNELYGNGSAPADTLAAGFQRIKNAIYDVGTTINESPIMDFLKTILGAVGLVVAGLVQGVLLPLDAAFTGVKIAITSLVAALSGDLTAAIGIAKEEGAALVDRQAKLAESMQRLAGITNDAAAASERDAEAKKKAATEAEKGAASLIALSSQYQKVREQIEKQIESAEKSAAARDAEGKAAVQLAQELGTEVDLRNAQSEAAKANSEALRELAERRLTEVNVLKAQLDATRAYLAQAGGAESEANRKKIQELTDLIEKRQLEADKAVAQARAAQISAESARTEAEALKDNSARVDELRKAYELAAAALEKARAERAAGRISADELAAAEIKAAGAAKLYRDALADQVVALEAAGRVRQANANLQQVGVRADIEAARAIYEVAKASGDERAAAVALVEVKRLEIQLARLQAEAKRAEANAALEVIKAKRAELQAADQLTAAKRAELQAQELAAQAKAKEADIATKVADKMEILTAATLQAKDAANESAKAYDTFSQSLGGANDQLERNIDLRSQQAGLPTSATGTTSGADGGSPFTRTAVGQNLTSIIGMLKGWGVGDAQAEQIARRFVDPNTNEIPAFGASEGQRAFSRSQFDTWSVALRRAAEEALYGGSGLAGSGTSAGGTPGALRTVNVNLSLGGRTTTVATASDADAQALEGFLRTLETDLRRASP